MSSLSRCFATALIGIAGVVLTSCSWFSPPPTPTVSDIVGLWKSDRFDAVLVMRDDMTFGVTNVPAGYIYGILPGGVDDTEKVTLSGTWAVHQAQDRFDYPDVVVSFLADDSEDHNFLGLQYSGDSLDRLYLTKGDPDNGDTLSFYRDAHDE